MLKIYQDYKQKTYLDAIAKLFNLPESEIKTAKLTKLLTEYSVFCYKNNLTKFTPDVLLSLENKGYILPSEPEMYELDEEKVKAAATHLKEVLENGGGISEEEATTLLKWSVGKTREYQISKGIDLKTYSLDGSCGECQAFTLLPFLNIGANVTVNNVHFFPFVADWHAFGSVELPISKDGTVVNERFLIDASYRQFYTILNNNEGRYLDTDEFYKNKVGPDAGYYTTMYPGGKEFALELLKKGYIKLTPEVLKIYGIGFVAEGLNATNADKVTDVFRLNPDLFWESLLRSESEIDYDEEDKIEISNMVNFPIEDLKRN